MNSSKKGIVVVVTASIAIYKACDIVTHFIKKGFVVTVVMTKEATKFISPLVFQSLSKNKVYIDMFEEALPYDPKHIAIAERADLILVVPASANIIGKIASGIMDDLASCVIFSCEKPVVFAPAMNSTMYKNKIVQENIKTLEKLGYKFIGPQKGYLVCGKTDVGHIADTNEIIKTAERLLAVKRK